MKGATMVRAAPLARTDFRYQPSTGQKEMDHVPRVPDNSSADRWKRRRHRWTGSRRNKDFRRQGRRRHSLRREPLRGSVAIASAIIEVIQPAVVPRSLGLSAR
jgi:hypothetical protein